ncbi:MerR family transcriptional regulator [Gracilibacillus salinarum]|uniref:MerR family transcriptional regulator n=1 Tax=Gracilibacillus salinarum TaxID=2932255 RepID=A0ABY4GLK7_9BACI|nr:MerR family transcriptional regulator [Gracilibacillus salinarum]UOQ85255.1 MerR family transcriptional regulator [Gracilibacillus salinarum]
MQYRIGELSKIIGISEHTLRYYEKEGLVVPERDNNNIRRYSEDNKLWAEFILHMKETGMSLEDLKKYTELWESGEEGIQSMLEILLNHRSNVLEKLETYKRNLELLNTKIEFYQSSIEKNKAADLYSKFVHKKNNEKNN